MSNLKVLVSGASVAGPSLAYWLAKVGASVTVVERFPHLRGGGQSIDIRTAGVTAMRRIPGMEAAVRERRAPIEGMSFVDDNGRRFGTLHSTGDPDQQSLMSEYEIFRDDLSRVLFDLTKESPRIKYVFGEQISSIQQDKDGNGPATVTFSNGLLPTTDFDLVVACDGATSRTRAIGLQCGPNEYLEPANQWAAFFTIEEDLLNGSKIGQAYCAPGGRFIAMGTDHQGNTRVTLLRFPPKGDTTTLESFRKAAQQGDSHLRQYIARDFEGVGWKCEQALRAMTDASYFYASESLQVKLPRLSNGRFVLVGDAGYAPGPTGTGTSLALAGAYVLAGELQQCKGDVATALKNYEAHMRPIIDEMQKVPSNLSSFVAPRTKWGLWVRNTVFALVTRSGIADFGQRYLAPAFASSGEYPLPVYEGLDSEAVQVSEEPSKGANN